MDTQSYIKNFNGSAAEAAVVANENHASRISRPRNDRAVRALVVGAGDVGQALAERLMRSGRYEVVGFADDDIENPSNSDLPVLGRRHETAEIIRRFQVEQVFLAYAPAWQQSLAQELAANHPEVGVQVVPSYYEAMMRIGHVRHVGDIALVPLKTWVGRPTRIAKRLADTLVAFALSALLWPLLLVIALLIRLTSRGPALFAQERVGQYGEVFTLYKFRTMRQDAEASTGPILSPSSADSRLTPLGKWLRIFRMDELPQLWNVLRGEMSLVGPRPERPCFTDVFQERDPIYARRHAVRPGITGLAQVCAGYHTDARDKLRFDLIYISHHSLWLDLTIVTRTLLLIFRSRDY